MRSSAKYHLEPIFNLRARGLATTASHSKRLLSESWQPFYHPHSSSISPSLLFLLLSYPSPPHLSSLLPFYLFVWHSIPGIMRASAASLRLSSSPLPPSPLRQMGVPGYCRQVKCRCVSRRVYMLVRVHVRHICVYVRRRGAYVDVCVRVSTFYFFSFSFCVCVCVFVLACTNEHMFVWMYSQHISIRMRP